MKRSLLARRSRRLACEQLEARLCMALDVPQFSSLPGANHTIYLDFDGHTTTGTQWNSANGIPAIVSPPFSYDADNLTFSTGDLREIEETWRRVTEDFAPFQVNVTTVEPPLADLIKSNGSDTRWGIRVVATDNVYNLGGGNIGGHAYVDSFNWNTDTPAFVYRTNSPYLGETISHEVGHTLGLSHDGTATAEYYMGHDGPPSWGTIMGTFGFKSTTQWDRGEYYGSNNAGTNANYGKGRDDLAIITSYNGFGYRTDDHANSLATADVLSIVESQAGDAGIIERTGETDWFQFTTDTGSVSLTVNPVVVSTIYSLGFGTNLDIQADLYDTNGTLLVTANSPTAKTATITADLTAGQYFLRVSPVGAGNPTVNPPTGYTNYGSLGQYTITGTVVPVNSDSLSIAATDAVKSEGNSGTSNYSFTVVRSGDTTGTTVASYAVTAGEMNPASATDFVGSVFPAGTITFAPDELTKTITIPVKGDTSQESDEQFIVSLTIPSGVTRIEQGHAVGTIKNDDGPAQVSIVASDAVKPEGTGGTSTPFTFTLVRSGSIASAGSVRYTVSGTGSNKANSSDFVGGFPSNVLVNFAANEASKTIALNVKHDGSNEQNETFQVKLSNASGMSITTSTATGTILNDDGSGGSGSARAAAIAISDPAWFFAPSEELTPDQLAQVSYETHHHDHADHSDHNHSPEATGEVATPSLSRAGLDPFGPRMSTGRFWSDTPTAEEELWKVEVFPKPKYVSVDGPLLWFRDPIRPLGDDILSIANDDAFDDEIEDWTTPEVSEPLLEALLPTIY